jgi:hypothetical protein
MKISLLYLPKGRERCKTIGVRQGRTNLIPRGSGIGQLQGKYKEMWEEAQPLARPDERHFNDKIVK